MWNEKGENPSKLSESEFDSMSWEEIMATEDKTVISWSIADLLWLAGLLEGEGSFHLSKPRAVAKLIPTVAVATTDKDVIRKTAKTLKTTYRSRGCRGTLSAAPKEQFVSSIANGKAAAVMEVLYPFMSARRKKQIKKALNGWFSPRSGRGPRRKKFKVCLTFN